MTESLCNVSDTCDVELDFDDVISTAGLSAALSYFAVVFLLSLLCNGTICVVFHKRPQLLTVSNSFVLNLTCCQLGLSILIMPFLMLSLVSRKWVMGDIWCRIQAYLLTVLVIALQYSLLVISVDRNYAIINSLRYPYVFSPRLGNLLIAVTWLLGFAIGMPPLFTYGELSYQRTQFVCGNTWESESKYSVFFILAAFLLPFIVQTCCYLSIFKAAIKHTKAANRVYPSVGSTSATQDISMVAAIEIDDVTSRVHMPRSRRTECKAVKTILIIYGSYVISWTFFIITGLMKAFGAQTSAYLDMTGICLVFLSCAINPVIYAFMNRLTRNEIWKYFSRAAQRSVGREPTVMESEEFYSTTLSTNFSSSRHTSGTFVPVARGRSNSIKVACARRGDMLTIHEVSETDDELITACALNESSKIQPKSTATKSVKHSSDEVLLRPSNFSKMSFRRCHSNDDMSRTVLKNVNGKIVPTVKRHINNTPKASQSRDQRRLLVRSQSFASGLSGNSLQAALAKAIKLRTALTIGIGDGVLTNGKSPGKGVPGRRQQNVITSLASVDEIL
ncbi:G-protein coupled receptor 161-like isoform X2 [Haliotis rufescens]|nr:G-protein coupled receptor 161-like isoform X2 [Haliotis rufescens]XP_048238816.1 G-protein coupled receptor 161-like isoform X2 [Haliotis rufescens]